MICAICHQDARRYVSRGAKGENKFCFRCATKFTTITEREFFAEREIDPLVKNRTLAARIAARTQNAKNLYPDLEI